MKDAKEKNDAYDARFAESLGGSEYDDLLLALDFYNEFQAETGKALKEYISKYCKDLKVIKVLEAGPGTGITTLELLKADPRVKVTSVDNEPKMLEAVKVRFADMGDLSTRVDFILADILKFLESCKDESFDAFASVYTLHNFTPDFRRKVLNLIAKKLKKGGIFINGDKYAQDGEAHRRDYAAELKNYDKFLAVADKEEKAGNLPRAAHFRKIREEWINHCAEDEKNKITVVEQNEIFKELGYKDIEWKKRFDLVVTVKAING
ncbi:MAG TPA: class I SAM-dependent methyltransferase [Candidatus Paceibacterota bacterium]|nr:class I SAM-dependent methyltransferase [Candidatus Paceibacterota bacterium]